MRSRLYLALSFVVSLVAFFTADAQIGIRNSVSAQLTKSAAAGPTWPPPPPPPTPAGTYTRLPTTHMRLEPSELFVPLGGDAWIAIEIREVSDLYAANVHLTFDSSVVAVLDAVPGGPVSLEVGNMPFPDFVPKNEANNTAGEIWYAVIQLAPRPPASGDGTLARAHIRGLTDGTTVMRFLRHELAVYDGSIIPNSVGTCLIRVGLGDGTPTPVPAPTDTPWPTPTRSPTPTRAPRESRYYASEDTYISQWHPTANYNRAHVLAVREGGICTSLLRFHLTVPRLRREILSASLNLYVCDRSNSGTLDAAVYKVHRGWVSSEATWEKAASSSNWDQPGCNGEGSDREALAADCVVLSALNRWFSFDVTDIVREWVANPASNSGLAIKGSGSTSVRYGFASSEYGDATFRPHLVVISVELPSPQTPTSTATLTGTPTPMPMSTPGGCFCLPLVMKGA